MQRMFAKWRDADGRSQRFWMNAVSTAMSNFAKIATSFTLVPILLAQLGEHTYGIWLACASQVMMLATIGDGGLTAGLVALVARANAAKGAISVREIVTNAGAVLSAVCALILVNVWLFAPWVDWKSVLSLHSEADRSIALTIFCIAASFFAIGLIGEMCVKVRIGLQQMTTANIWIGVSALLSIPAVLMAIRLNTGIVGLCVAAFGTPTLVILSFSAHYLFHSPSLQPRFSNVSVPVAKTILGSGGGLFFVALAQVVAVQSDSILIANLLSVSEVTRYSLVQRLFFIPTLMGSFIFAAMWPLISQANAKGDHDWIRQIYYRALISTSAVGIALAGFLYIFFNPILKLWIGDDVAPDHSLVIAFAIFAPLPLITSCCSTLLAAMEVRRPLAIVSLVMMIVNLTASIILIPLIGSLGAIIGSIISYLFCMALPYLIIVPNYLSSLRMKQPEI